MLFGLVKIFSTRMDDSFAVTDSEMLDTIESHQIDNCDTSSSCAIHHDADFFFFLSGYFKSIDESREGHNRGTVLIVVHDRYRELCFQSSLNLKTSWR